MFLGMLLILFASPTQTDQWSKTFEVSASPKLTVKTGDAHIHVVDGESNVIEARVTTNNWKIGEGGIKIVDRQTGNEVRIDVQFPHNWGSFGFNHRRVDVELRVPRHITLDLNTGDGNIDIKGVSGGIVLHTGDGHLDISDVEGEMRAETGDGPVTLKGVKGNTSLHTGDGRIEVDGFDGSLRAETGDGRVRVSGRFDVLQVKTGDGGVEATALAGSQMTTDWTLETGDGGLTVRIPS